MYWIFLLLFSQCTTLHVIPRHRKQGISIFGPKRPGLTYTILRRQCLSNIPNLPYRPPIVQSPPYLPNTNRSKAPEWGSEYSPSAQGYEPYWKGGEWVFDDGNKPQGICGLPCPYAYRKLGVVCAKNKYYDYQTFENMCEMRKADCHNVIGWVPVYEGPCTPEQDLKTYPTPKGRMVQDRAKSFMDNFMKDSKRTTIWESKPAIQMIFREPANLKYL